LDRPRPRRRAPSEEPDRERDRTAVAPVFSFVVVVVVVVVVVARKSDGARPRARRGTEFFDEASALREQTSPGHCALRSGSGRGGEIG
jgi:hypothetical protein